MQIISTFYYGNFQQKALIINIALRLAYVGLCLCLCQSVNQPLHSIKKVGFEFSEISSIKWNVILLEFHSFWISARYFPSFRFNGLLFGNSTIIRMLWNVPVSEG